MQPHSAPRKPLTSQVTWRSNKPHPTSATFVSHTTLVLYAVRSSALAASTVADALYSACARLHALNLAIKSTPFALSISRRLVDSSWKCFSALRTSAMLRLPPPSASRLSKIASMALASPLGRSLSTFSRNCAGYSRGNGSRGGRASKARER